MVGALRPAKGETVNSHATNLRLLVVGVAIAALLLSPLLAPSVARAEDTLEGTTIAPLFESPVNSPGAVHGVTIWRKKKGEWRWLRSKGSISVKRALRFAGPGIYRADSFSSYRPRLTRTYTEPKYRSEYRYYTIPDVDVCRVTGRSVAHDRTRLSYGGLFGQATIQYWGNCVTDSGNTFYGAWQRDVHIAVDYHPQLGRQGSVLRDMEVYVVGDVDYPHTAQQQETVSVPDGHEVVTKEYLGKRRTYRESRNIRVTSSGQVYTIGKTPQLRTPVPTTTPLPPAPVRPPLSPGAQRVHDHYAAMAPCIVALPRGTSPESAKAILREYPPPASLVAAVSADDLQAGLVAIYERCTGTEWTGGAIPLPG